ncbi:DUF418 domain-containing protein [Sphingomonas sp. A2-49]|uniref:DUF418 domain-containing protein n=1 Tax=Sphingomonas sp. A2-49 TaxID=1391375 RepID=UPI0021D13B72|nr:DUF418 domain-containing protein [Sphingomonas sp. A2-49]MCU6453854.1 DUF418 domain-containing protein [Sphingomonas sp. A2-49]
MIAARDEPDGAPRLATLDILRGLAILGILFMNVSEMGASMTANWSDIRHLGWNEADRIAWWLRTLLVEGTARGLLEMLFGAGMLILTDRIATASAGALALPLRYGWRNIVLWAFGMAHMALLLWPGDILHTYAVAALFACTARALPPRAMLAIGLSYAAFTMATGVGAIGHEAGVRAAAGSGDRTAVATLRTMTAERARFRVADAAAVRREDAAGRGDARAWAVGQWRVAVSRLGGDELVFIWEAAATMLIGAALFRWGALGGGWSRRRYGWLLAAGYGVGLPLRTYAAWEATRFDARVEIAWVWEDAARLAMTAGHLAIVMLLASSPRAMAWLRPFAATGRTALTLYVAQTMIVSWLVFSPMGLGLYGRLGWASMMLLALAVDALLVWAAILYLRRYRIAPVEWAWRSLVEGRRLPIRRQDRSGPGARTAPSS